MTVDVNVDVNGPGHGEGPATGNRQRTLDLQELGWS
jgi:hypothetical protein